MTICMVNRVKGSFKKGVIQIIPNNKQRRKSKYKLERLVESDLLEAHFRRLELVVHYSAHWFSSSWINIKTIMLKSASKSFGTLQAC